MTLPINYDGQQAFNMMLNAAKKLATEIPQQVLDGSRQLLTRQSIQQAHRKYANTNPRLKEIHNDMSRSSTLEQRVRGLEQQLTLWYYELDEPTIPDSDTTNYFANCNT